MPHGNSSAVAGVKGYSDQGIGKSAASILVHQQITLGAHTTTHSNFFIDSSTELN